MVRVILVRDILLVSVVVRVILAQDVVFIFILFYFFCFCFFLLWSGIYIYLHIILTAFSVVRVVLADDI